LPPLLLLLLLQVHLFSGGGFIFMGWVFQILAELEPHNAQAADVRSRIRGVIFDSSPADVTAGEPRNGICTCSCLWLCWYEGCCVCRSIGSFACILCAVLCDLPAACNRSTSCATLSHLSTTSLVSLLTALHIVLLQMFHQGH
jgi:hypothetical protein